MDDEGFVVERGDEDLIIPPTTDENAIEKGKELSLWAALATCAVMYSVPYGFVRGIYTHSRRCCGTSWAERRFSGH